MYFFFYSLRILINILTLFNYLINQMSTISLLNALFPSNIHDLDNSTSLEQLLDTDIDDLLIYLSNSKYLNKFYQ